MHELMLVDTLARPLRNLRLSVTDRCNLRCEYCMPEDEYVWLPREDMLHFEEISTLADLFITLGIDKIRLTGGEPLMRRDLPSLVQMLAVKPGLSDLALTTNGVLLAEQIDALRAAGLGRITVSLDTLRSDRFVRLTRFDRLDAVLEGMTAASRAFGSAEAGSLRSRPRSSAGGGGVPRPFKIDSVIIRGVNDDELVDLIEYGKSQNAEVRFIEYMDVGGATRWSRSHVVSRQEMLDTLARRYGAVEPVIENSSAPADPLRAAGRYAVRHHLLDHRSVLQQLRSQPVDGRRPVVPVPLRGARHRLSSAAARRRLARGADRTHHGRMARAHRPRCRGTPGPRRRAPRLRADREPPQGPAPRNAHAGGIGADRTGCVPPDRSSAAVTAAPLARPVGMPLAAALEPRPPGKISVLTVHCARQLRRFS